VVTGGDDMSETLVPIAGAVIFVILWILSTL